MRSICKVSFLSESLMWLKKCAKSLSWAEYLNKLFTVMARNYKLSDKKLPFITLKFLDNFHRNDDLHILEHQFWNFEKECTKTEMRVKRVGEKKMSVVAIICEHYKGTWWRMAFLINVASSIVTNIALVGPWFKHPRLRDRGTWGGGGQVLLSNLI